MKNVLLNKPGKVQNYGEWSQGFSVSQGKISKARRHGLVFVNIIRKFQTIDVFLCKQNYCLEFPTRNCKKWFWIFSEIEIAHQLNRFMIINLHTCVMCKWFFAILHVTCCPSVQSFAPKDLKSICITVKISSTFWYLKFSGQDSFETTKFS